jgi:DNA adenine methylase
MKQYSFLEDIKQEKPINISTIPQRSPFRYPGGKTWLVPTIRRWIKHFSYRINNFIEPFVGGGIISLTVAFENLADLVTMVELDSDVAAVWEVILSDENKWLADKILGFDLNVDSANMEIVNNAISKRDIAFKTILKNRISHGGILAPGAGLIKNGENGKGIHSRWYPQTISKRISNIRLVKNKMNFIHGDGFEIIQKNLYHPSTIFFIDPPYTVGGKKAGSRLYRHSEIDHDLLFKLASSLPDSFLMTYDNTKEVYDLAKKYNFDTEVVLMNNTHHANMNELLVSRDLEWYRR